MLNNAATIAVAGVGGTEGATTGAGVSTAAWRPPALGGTASVPGDVDCSGAGDVPAWAEVLVPPVVAADVAGVEVVVDDALEGVVDEGVVAPALLLVVGAACRGPDDVVVGALVGAGPVVVGVGVGELEPPEPAGVPDAPPVAVELGTKGVDDGAVPVEVAADVADGADDEVAEVLTLAAAVLSVEELGTACPPASEVTEVVSAPAVPAPAAQAPAIATAPPASFAARTQFRLALIGVLHLSLEGRPVTPVFINNPKPTTPARVRSHFAMDLLETKTSVKQPNRVTWCTGGNPPGSTRDLIRSDECNFSANRCFAVRRFATTPRPPSD
ncbi:MAG: hypothetical protein PGN29_00925 [Gordonia paraffinivorans]